MEAQSGQDSAQEHTAERQRLKVVGPRGQRAGGQGRGPHKENESKRVCTPLCKVLPPHFIIGHFQQSERVLSQSLSCYTEEHELTETARRTQHHEHTEQSPVPLDSSLPLLSTAEAVRTKKMPWTPDSSERLSPALSCSQVGPRFKAQPHSFTFSVWPRDCPAEGGSQQKAGEGV